MKKMFNSGIKKYFTLPLFLLLFTFDTSYSEPFSGFLPVITINENKLFLYNKKLELEKPVNFTSGKITLTSTPQKIYLVPPENRILEIDLTSMEAKFSANGVLNPLPFKKDAYRTIVAIGDDTLYLNKHDLLYKNHPLKHNLNSSDQFSALFIGKNDLYIGTTTSGLWVALDFLDQLNKNRDFLFFKKLRKGLPFLMHDNRVSLYEEIKSIYVSDNNTIITGTGVSPTLNVKKNLSLSFEEIQLPDKLSNKTGDIYYISATKEMDTIWASHNEGLIILHKKNDGFSSEFLKWNELELCLSNVQLTFFKSKINNSLTGYCYNPATGISAEKQKRIKTATDKKLFYVSPYNFTQKKAKVEKLLSNSIYNGVIIDIKDDQGHVSYPSKVPYLNKIGAVKRYIDLQEIIHSVHKKNRYITARVVVFKDPVMFEVENFPILDKRTGKPWIGNHLERWIDPYNPSLAEIYYVPLFKELEQMGIDEIQLDYIRFPSDGGVKNCIYSNNKNGLYKSEAIEFFLHEVREAISIPLSVDVYGYNGIYRIAGIIGQDVEVYGRYADIVSPMLYSSHFGDMYLTDIEISKRIYRLIKHSVSRANEIASSEYIVRPYLQAFPMKNNIWGYGNQYFQDQIAASLSAGGNGFSFWGSLDNMITVNNSNHEQAKK